jgi:hypothetical protein
MEGRKVVVGSGAGALIFASLMALGGASAAIADLGESAKKTSDSTKRFTNSANRFRGERVSYGLYYDRVEFITVWTEEDKQLGKVTPTVIKRVVSHRYNPRLVFSSDMRMHSAEGRIPETPQEAQEIAWKHAKGINSRRGDYKRSRLPGGPRVYVKPVTWGEESAEANRDQQEEN